MLWRSLHFLGCQAQGFEKEDPTTYFRQASTGLLYERLGNATGRWEHEWHHVSYLELFEDMNN